MLARLWRAANQLKNASEWLSLLGWIGVPGATAAVAFFTGQPWDIVLLYVLAGVAFGVVLYVEGSPILAEYLGRPGLERRNALARWLVAGQNLAERASPGYAAERHFALSLLEDVEHWVSEVQTYCRNHPYVLGESAIARFRQNALLPSGAVSASRIGDWLQACENAIRRRCANLQAIIAGLPD